MGKAQAPQLKAVSLQRDITPIVFTEDSKGPVTRPLFFACKSDTVFLVDIIQIGKACVHKIYELCRTHPRSEKDRSNQKLTARRKAFSRSAFVCCGDQYSIADFRLAGIAGWAFPG